VVGSKP